MINLKLKIKALFTITLFAFIFVITQSALASECFPIDLGFSGNVRVEWSGALINLREIREMACNGNITRQSDEILSILEKNYGFIIVDTIGDRSSKAIGSEKKKPFIKLFDENTHRTSERINQNSEWIDTEAQAIFIAPHYPAGSMRPFIEKPVMVLGAAPSGTTLIHEFMHYLLWRDCKDLTGGTGRHYPRSESLAKLEERREQVKKASGALENSENSEIKSLEQIMPLAKAAIKYLEADLENLNLLQGEEIDVTFMNVKYGRELGFSEDDIFEEAKYAHFNLQEIEKSIIGWKKNPLLKVIINFRTDLDDTCGQILDSCINEMSDIYDKVQRKKMILFDMIQG